MDYKKGEEKEMRYKIVYRAIFTEKFIKLSKGQNSKKYFQCTVHYNAKSKQEALEKLYANHGVKNNELCSENTWSWKVMKCEKEEQNGV